MSELSGPAFTLDDRKLKKLIKALKGEIPLGRVGILGSSPRTEKGPTNAEIGAAHEYGTEVLPQRSFLRIPISENLEKYLENAGAFNELTLKKVIQEGSIREWVMKMAMTAKQVVDDAFSTSGFGRWKKSDMTHKKNHSTLIETQQLRDSITTEVK